MILEHDYTLAAASLTGYASNVSGAAWTLTANTAGDGLQHPVTIRNDSATDHSGKTIALVGTDANGNSQTETLTAPAGSATVTSAKEYKTLTSATPSATIGADTFDIGWTAVGSSPFFVVDHRDLGLTVGVHVGGTVNYDVDLVLHNTTDGAATVYKATNLTGKTVKAYDFLAGAVFAVRLHINSHTSGVVHIDVLQDGT
jgi:hypothetical protein